MNERIKRKKDNRKTFDNISLLFGNNQVKSINMDEYPIGCQVVLTNLTKTEFNGKLGVVQSKLNQNGRQQVAVSFPAATDASSTPNKKETIKQLGLKPINLTLKPRPVDSLSAREMKTVLSRKDYSGSLAGYDKSELKALVEAHVSSPEEVASILAKPSTSSSAEASQTSNRANGNGNSGTSNLRQQMQNQAAQLNQLSPDQLRQQAQMMRSMDPNMIRRMNPAMANCTDAQIHMAAAQMEQMANNPSMIQGMVDQMKNMDDAQLEQVQQMQQGGGTGAAAGMPAPPGSVPAAPTAESMSAGMQNMQNMSPDQLRQQAQMMKSMPKDTLRSMNPLMANWPDSQIDMAIAQMEQMANNPEASKKMMDQMKNMKPEDMENIRKMAQSSGLGGGGGGGSGGSGSIGGLDPASMAEDPMAMLNNTDPAQLKSMLTMVKDNPELFKNMMRAANPGMADQLTDEQISKTMETFANLDENKIGWLIKGLGVLQSIRTILKKRGVLLAIGFVVFIFFGLLLFVMKAKSVKSVASGGSVEEVPNLSMKIPEVEEDEF